MKKVSYLLILLFIFTLSLHKASAADVWLGFDEAWATTP